MAQQSKLEVQHSVLIYAKPETSTMHLQQLNTSTTSLSQEQNSLSQEQNSIRALVVR